MQTLTYDYGLRGWKCIHCGTLLTHRQWCTCQFWYNSSGMPIIDVDYAGTSTVEVEVDEHGNIVNNHRPKT